MAYLPTPSAETGFAAGLKMTNWPGGVRQAPRYAVPGLPALLFAHGTWAGIAQVDETVMRNVTIVPFNVHPSTGGEVYLHRLGIGRGGGQMKRGLHIFSIA